MQCTFYRPEKINCKEYENIIGKLYLDFLELKTKTGEDWSIHQYLYNLSSLARPFHRCPGMNFYGLVEPDKVPADIRVVYFYFPTYIVGAILIQAVLQFPGLLNPCGNSSHNRYLKVSELKEWIRSVLLGCTGRDFEGDGRDCPFSFFDNMRLFLSAGAEEFVRQYPDLCPEFTELFRKRLPEFQAHDPEEWKHSHWEPLDIDR